MTTEVSVLDNGVRVVSCSMPHVGSVAVGIWASVGARHEPRRLNGISHFIEHLLFKGTPKRSAKRIMQEVEGVGGDINAETTEERTCYYASAPAEYFRRVADVLADIYLNPRFAPRDIELERSVIAEEIQMYRDEPSQHVHDLLSGIFWKDNSLGRPITGTLGSISEFTRGDFIAYRKSHYHAANTILSAAGNITHDDLLAFAKDTLCQMKRKNRKIASNASPDLRGGTEVSLEDRDIEQTHVAIGLPCPSFHEQSRYATTVLHTLLGGNGSSRLFQDLREKRGYCYNVSTYPLFLSNTGMFTISLALDAANLKKAFQIIYKHFDDLSKHLVKENELRRAKEYVIGVGRMSLERTSSQNSRIATSLMSYGRVVDPEEVHEHIRQVTAEDVREIARYTLDRTRLKVSVIGRGIDKDNIYNIILQ